MQNVVQPASESVGNCVKQHEVGLHRANPAIPATSTSSAKPSKSQGNSVPKTSQNAGRSQTSAQQTHPSNLNHKTVTVTDLASSSTALATEIAIQQVKQSRSFHQYMPDSSDSDSDDVLSVSWDYCENVVCIYFGWTTLPTTSEASLTVTHSSSHSSMDRSPQWRFSVPICQSASCVRASFIMFIFWICQDSHQTDDNV